MGSERRRLRVQRAPVIRIESTHVQLPRGRRLSSHLTNERENLETMCCRASADKGVYTFPRDRRQLSRRDRRAGRRPPRRRARLTWTSFTANGRKGLGTAYSRPAFARALLRDSESCGDGPATSRKRTKNEGEERRIAEGGEQDKREDLLERSDFEVSSGGRSGGTGGFRRNDLDGRIANMPAWCSVVRVRDLDRGVSNAIGAPSSRQSSSEPIHSKGYAFQIETLTGLYARLRRRRGADHVATVRSEARRCRKGDVAKDLERVHR